MKTTDLSTLSFTTVYPLYIAKAERKGRTADEVHEIIRWMTGYTDAEIAAQATHEVDFGTFFSEAPAMNPARLLITGSICGVRVQDLEDGITREVRYLDKLIDELAKGKAMEKILRTP